MFPPAFVAAVPVFRSIRYECHSAVPAHLHRMLFVCHHETEFHLDTGHQRIEVPDNNGMLMKLQMVGRGDTAESCRRLLPEIFPPCIQMIIILVVVESVGLVGKRGYAALAAGGLKAVGRLAVDSF